MSKKVEEIQGKIDALTAKQRGILEAAGKDADGNSNVTQPQIEEMKQAGDEVNALMTKLQIAKLEDRMDAQGKEYELINALPVDGGKSGNGFSAYEGKSFEEGLREDPSIGRYILQENGKDVFNFSGMSEGERVYFRSRVNPISVLNPGRAVMTPQGKVMVLPDYEGKTLTTAAGIAPFSYPVAGYTPIPQENPTLLDIITQESNDNQLFTFLRQSLNTNSAAVVAEGNTKPEGGMQATYITKKFNVIAEYFNVTDQDLRFVPNAMALFTQQGTLHVRQTTQNQIINGAGTGAADTGMEGILNATGKLTSASTGTSAQLAAEAIARGAAKVNSYNFAAANVARANAVVVNPGDMYQIRMTKNSFNNYIWPTNEDFKGFIGVPYLVETAFIAAGTSIAGDFSGEKITFAWSMNNGVAVVVGYLANDFGSNKRTIRFEVWGVNAIKQPSAFCAVTNGLSALS